MFKKNYLITKIKKKYFKKLFFTHVIKVLKKNLQKKECRYTFCWLFYLFNCHTPLIVVFENFTPQEMFHCLKQIIVRLVR